MLTDALAASELRYRRLFETARDGILLVDPETRRIAGANPVLGELLGYAPAEIVGRELSELGPPENAAAHRLAFDTLRTAGSIRCDDLPLQTKDGRRVDVELVGTLYREGDRPMIQCAVRDISARRKAEAAQREAKEIRTRRTAELENLVNLRAAELQLSNSQLETFVYSIAHDLRAPLRAMQGFAQLLVLDHAASLDPQGRSYATFIDQAARTMDLLISDLLAFSHISQQKIELMPVTLAEAVRSALAGCEAEIRETGAVIDCLPPWPVVLAHGPTLRQVLVNLIGNAVKFVAGRPAHIRLRAEEQPDGRVRVWVEDNGIGIAAEFQERIFQVFQRLHTTAYAGTGIGLAIVQKGVERMGGCVGVESVPGQGSNFWFELARAPLAATAPRPQPIFP